MAVETWFIELSEEECEDLLAAAPLGRLGVVRDGRPEIFPVSHVYDRPLSSVVFPSHVGTKLHAALDWPFVAFEVDGGEDDERGAWSVLVVGRAEEVTDPAVIERCSTMRTVRWAAGAGTRWLRVVPSKVTGRRIRAVER